MKKYELLFVLPGTLDENEASTRSQEILDLVKETAETAEIHEMGKNRLSYPIKGIRYGYYFTVVFEATSENLGLIQEKFSLIRDLLRFMITHFNMNAGENKGVTYTTNQAGITTIERDKKEKKKVLKAEKEEKSEDKPEEKEEEKKKEEKMKLDDIDDKLDEILKGDIMPGI